MLSVEGEVIDPPDGRQLYDAICKQVRDGACAVSLDLAGTKLLGAAGITALIRAQADASRLGCEVTVVAASHVVRRVLEVTLVAGPLGLPEQ